MSPSVSMFFLDLRWEESFMLTMFVAKVQSLCSTGNCESEETVYDQTDTCAHLLPNVCLLVLKSCAAECVLLLCLCAVTCKAWLPAPCFLLIINKRWDFSCKCPKNTKFSPFLSKFSLARLKVLLMYNFIWPLYETPGTSFTVKLHD